MRKQAGGKEGERVGDRGGVTAQPTLRMNLRAGKPRPQEPRRPSCQVAKSATYQSPEARFPGSRAQGCAPQMQPFSSYGESGGRRGTLHFPGVQGGLADLPRVPCHGLGAAENSPSPKSTVTRGWSGFRLAWQTLLPHIVESPLAPGWHFSLGTVGTPGAGGLAHSNPGASLPSLFCSCSPTVHHLIPHEMKY